MNCKRIAFPACLASCLALSCAQRTVTYPRPIAPSAPPAAVEIPFEFERNQIVLSVEMNGRGPFNVLLDTGGNPSAVDLAAARRADLPVNTDLAGEAEGVGGERIPIYAARILHLELGGHAAGNLAAVALDLSRISQRLGRPLHGILGYNFFAERIVQIDYPRRTVRLLSEPPVMPNDARFVTMPLTALPGATIPLIEAFYVNGTPIKVTLDTGSSLALELFPPAVEYLALEREQQATRTGPVVGARDAADIKHGQLDTLAIGPFVFKDQPVAFAQRDKGPNREWGNLGNAFLQHFVLTLDYRNKTITFQR